MPRCAECFRGGNYLVHNLDEIIRGRAHCMVRYQILLLDGPLSDPLTFPQVISWPNILSWAPSRMWVSNAGLPRFFLTDWAASPEGIEISYGIRLRCLRVLKSSRSRTVYSPLSEFCWLLNRQRLRSYLALLPICFHLFAISKRTRPQPCQRQKRIV